MKSIILSSAACLLLAASVVFSQGVEASGGKVGSVTVTESGIAGMSVKVHVQGPGRYTVKDIEQKTPDGTRIIGNSVKEVTIIPTGVGTIEVTITTKAPNDDAVRTQKLKIEAK